MTYPNLMKPLRVGSVLFKNRLFSAPQGLHAMQDRETYPPEAVIANISAKARGGAAQVTCHTTSAASRTDGSGADTDYDIFDPVSRRFVAQMAEEIHFYDAVASMELNFLTQPEGYDVCDGLIGMDGCPTKAITEELMRQMADSYAEQALLCRELGYDMVMLHMGYQFSLPARFLSPAMNRRTDEYGGTAENRARFPILICDAIKAACGKDFPIEIRMSGSEETVGGITLEDAEAYAQALVGHADLLQIHGPNGTASHCMGFQEPQPFVEWAGRIKGAVPDMGIVAIGGFQRPEAAEEAIAAGKADAVSIGRGWIADPLLGVKAAEGRSEDIVPCVKCMRCHDTACIEKVVYRCSVNPEIGLEHKLARLVPAPGSPKRVAVVGGGPAGMYAALLARRRGHAVTLFEATDRLGGQLCFADGVAFKTALREYRDHLILQVRKSDITVRMRTRADAALLRSEGYDAILAALGAVPAAPAFCVEGTVWNAIDVYGREEELGRSVIVIGGGEVGCETALHLAQRGHDVILLSRSARLAKNASSTWRSVLLGAMSREASLRAATRAEVTAVESGTVRFRTPWGTEESLTGDSVVIAAGMSALTEEAAALFGAADRVTLIGDCKAVGSLETVTRTAWAGAMCL